MERIGIIATRLGGLDGVSLEVDKWTKFLKQNQKKVFFCCGKIEYPPEGFSQISGKNYQELKKANIIPELSISHPQNKIIRRMVFQKKFFVKDRFEEKVEIISDKIAKKIEEWARENKIEKIIVENINSLPDHIPAGVGIFKFLKRNSHIFCLFHHHDFYWERDYFKTSQRELNFYFKKFFPPKEIKNSLHVTINTIAQKELLKRHKISSIVVGNVFDGFSIKKDKYNSIFREKVGIKKEDLLFLVPVRIIPRKNIETAVEIVKKLQDLKIFLLIAGCCDYYQKDYFKKIKQKAKVLGEKIKFVCDLIAPRRFKKNIFTIFDVYANADFVLYPSFYEGWGNVIGEAMIGKIPLLVNRYPVFKKDIEKKGFWVVKMEKGMVSQRVIDEIKEVLENKDLKRKMTEKNYFLIKKYYGFDMLEKKLKKFLKI